MNEEIFFYTRVGATGKVLDMILSDNSGAFDLTGCTANFVMTGSSGVRKVFRAGVPDPNQVTNKGRVKFNFHANDLNEIAKYRAEWQVTHPTRGLFIFPTGKTAAGITQKFYIIVGSAL